MKIELETKFDIGQTVYSLKDKMGVVIVGIGACITKSADAARSETEISYVCSLKDEHKSLCIFGEDELTAEKPKPTIYDLKPGDEYFFIDQEGVVWRSVWPEAHGRQQVAAWINAFLTRKEADKELERRKVHQELKILANGYEFAVGKSNYYIQYDASRDTIHKGSTECLYTPGVVYFPTDDAVKDAIRKIGEERMIQDYFGAEGENDQN